MKPEPPNPEQQVSVQTSKGNISKLYKSMISFRKMCTFTFFQAMQVTVDWLKNIVLTLEKFAGFSLTE